MTGRAGAFLMILFSTFVLQSQELLINNDFEYGLAGWRTRVPAGGSVMAVDYSWGTDVEFSLFTGGSYIYDVQLIQTGISVRPGYTYTITFGGSGYYADKPIMVGIGKDGSETTGDGSELYPSYIEAQGVLESNTYGEYEVVWVNEDILDNNARFFINGGGTNIDFTIAWASVFESETGGGNTSNEAALVNQIGFYTNGQKLAVVRNSTGGTYEIRNSQGSAVWSGTIGTAQSYDPSRETVRVLDFTTLAQAGTFAVYKDGAKISRDFVISSAPHKSISAAALKAFYFQRASTSLTSTYAGSWARSAGHPDNVVYRHSSAGSGTFSSPKGWYDAGDYGKYIVNSGITTYTLLHLYEHFTDYMNSVALNIPESTNSLADVLDEIKWNLDWMLTMQAADGGVYHKLTPLVFDGEVMPSACTANRYVFMKTTSAALNFVAVMAKASRLYADQNSAFAATCLQASKSAFAWALANPAVYYTQPSGVNTGEYGDDKVTDEKFWAAAELKAATNDPSYDTYLLTFPATPVPDWSGTGALGLFTIVSNQLSFSSTVVGNAKSKITSLADSLVTNQNCGYRNSMTIDDFIWGSNSVAANQGIVLLHAYYLTEQKKYLNAALSQLDYLLGRNPVDICYVTGFGQKSPLNPHHRISVADGVTAPVPGFLVGGPHTGGDDLGLYGCATNYLKYEANSYLDNYCSYATNEVAINWNASFAYLSNALEALNNGYKANGFSNTPQVGIPVLIPYTPKETRDTKPLLRWKSVQGATSYQIAISSDLSFSAPSVIPVTDTFYVSPVNLALGPVFWRVKSNLNTAWSSVDNFKIVGDSVPVLIPFAGECVSSKRPVFRWRSASGASSYTIRIADNLAFTSAISVPVSDTLYIPSVDMEYGTYYWKVSSSNSSSLFTSADTIQICLESPVVNSLMEKRNAGLTYTDRGSSLVFSVPGLDRAGLSVLTLYTVSGRKILSVPVSLDGSSFIVKKKLTGKGVFIAKFSNGERLLSKRVMIK